PQPPPVRPNHYGLRHATPGASMTPAARPTDRVDADGASTRSSAPAGAPDSLRGLKQTSSKSRGRGRGEAWLRQQLSDRDLAVLHSLDELRLLTTRHIERLHFREGSPRTQARRCRAVLQRLYSYRLLDRLDRRVGGIRAGSATMTYRLTPKARR